MKVSIFDVAKKSGLSVVTVSRVINQSGTVRQKNRDKVLRAMEELDYRPNASARSLARGKTGNIGLTLTTLDDSFFDAVVKEVNDRLTEQGYYLALSVSTDSDQLHRNLFQADRVDGVIMLSPTDEIEYGNALRKNNIPFVMIDNQLPRDGVTSIILDNFKGGYEATKHLIDLGHRKISHIKGPEVFLSSRERERGYLFALEEAGLSPHSIEGGEFGASTGYEIGERWMRNGNMPTAVFAADDGAALGFMDVLKNEGLRIPRDLSVVGFDDQLLAGQLRPKLSTVRQPADQMAQIAVELLLAAISGNKEETQHRTVKLEPTLIVRGSTARYQPEDIMKWE